MSSKKDKKNLIKKIGDIKNIKIILAVIITISVLLILFYLMMPKLYINGKKVITLNYNENYKELGIKGKYLGKDITNRIKISGNVNTKKIGKYKVSYNLKLFLWNITKTRIVNVVDSKKPEIMLVGDANLNMCPDAKFEEPGYIAVDEYDGNLTKKVKVTEKQDKIIYQVSDKSKNKFEIERIITRKDDEAPTISLNGSSTYYHRINTTFNEPGYTASDNCDSDLTKKVTVTGNVDANKEGKYTLTYTVKDNSGNETKVERIVRVYKKVDVNSGVTKKGVIYLTFDDGPSQETTTKILDILKEENVKATFFVTNNGPDSLIKREYDEGHTIALHTASHSYPKIYSSVDNYFADLKQVSDRVKRITGQESMIIRFPGGSSNTVSRRYSQKIMTVLTNEVLSRGYRYYDWNVDSNDAGACTKSSVTNKKACVYNNVVNNLSKNRANNVLMHDIKYHTVEALRDIIRYGKDNGYTFEAINMDTAMVHFKVNN